ncbi:MAG: hypothetical protein KDE58_04560 [Caldilineaceae bacterium]|nr:hypothetical protein [Caldilineaceae bacterium]
MSETFLLGIRHHGPGSAYSVRQALADIQPDLILIEGPGEAEAILPLVADPAMAPPVALLCYAEDNLADAAFYPYATFSPEWQALQFGLQQGLPIRMMDLPQTHHVALYRQAKREAEMALVAAEATESTPTVPPYLQERALDADPLTLLAQAAGFEDGERWWEQLVEERSEGLPVFVAIAEAMVAVRAEVEQDAGLPYREALREAWMRQTLRQAQDSGFERIAVICGAWHVPALQRLEATPTDAAGDLALLKGLPKCKTVVTWTPWSYGRLAVAGGYRAGVSFPGWYDFLWQSHHQPRNHSTYVGAGWLARIAHLLRQEGHDVATANVIEAVRLAEALTALRGKSLPTLEELNEAALATLCFGDDAQLRLIEERLVVGERLGSVPPETPLTPLQSDLARQQRTLRLKAEADERVLELDLRQSTGLERSKLLHRLHLLTIPWGQLEPAGRGKGTFREVWHLQWQPEFVVRLIEMSIWGSSVIEATTGYLFEQLRQSSHLAQIAATIDQALLADLPAVVDFAVQRLQAEAAVAGDVTTLMTALPTLARVLRYGNVRATDVVLLEQILDGFVTRIAIGLPAACYSLDDDAAEAMLTKVEACHDALMLLQEDSYVTPWWEAIARLADQVGLHGLLAGKCCRLLLNAERLSGEAAANRFHFALSTAGQPEEAAAWLRGMLRGSGLLLVHDERIWSVVDQWLVGLSEEHFLNVLPLVRRTFADFAFGERRMMGEKVKTGPQPQARTAQHQERLFDPEAAVAALPVVLQMLGLHAPET